MILASERMNFEGSGQVALPAQLRALGALNSSFEYVTVHLDYQRS